MSELQSKAVLTRKPHQCEWCGDVIAAGKHAQYRVLIFLGEFIHGWQHSECFTAMNKSNPDWLAEGWTEGENLRGKAME